MRGGKDVCVVLSYLELQNPPQALQVQLRQRYIRQGEKGGTIKGGLQGGLVGVSAKVQVHQLFCLTWPTDDNIIIIKKPAESFITGHYHYLSYSSQHSPQNIMSKICCFGVRRVLFCFMHIMLKVVF